MPAAKDRILRLTGQTWQSAAPELLGTLGIRQGMARRGAARFGRAWRGKEYGAARPGAALHGVA